MTFCILSVLSTFHIAAQDAPVLPLEKTSPTKRLDGLFETLQAAQTPQEAQRAAAMIERIWLKSGSDSADLLMERAQQALAKADYPLAVEIIDRVLVLQPDWAEAWNRRATLFFLMGDYPRSISDIRETLAREPRHFGALTGLGTILLASGDKPHAYGAFKRALALYPLLETVQTAAKGLQVEVEGSDL